MKHFSTPQHFQKIEIFLLNLLLIRQYPFQTEYSRAKKLSHHFIDRNEMILTWYYLASVYFSVLYNFFQSQNDSLTVKGPCAGVIQKISLRNFKCHSALDFDLHPYINFIIGRNGSGKSAVMDAIILCLGGRAGGK